MTQVITCPSCKQQLQVPEEFLGQPVKCPGCGVAFVVTAPTGTSTSTPASTPMEPSEPVTPKAPPPGPTSLPPFGPWGDSARPQQQATDVYHRSAPSVMGPAIGLLFVGVITLMCTGSEMYLLLMPEETRAKLIDQLVVDAQLRDQVKGMLAAPGTFGIVLRITFLFMSLTILAAALAMMNRRMYGLAATGSILAMIYLNECCCLLGFPIGLWALLVLLTPEVRDSFQ